MTSRTPLPEHQIDTKINHDDDTLLDHKEFRPREGWAWCSCGWMSGRPAMDHPARDFEQRAARHLQFHHDGIDPAALRAALAAALGLDATDIRASDLRITRDYIEATVMPPFRRSEAQRFQRADLDAGQQAALNDYLDYGPDREPEP